MAFQFTPSDGYRNVVSFPTKPANETVFRDSMQTLLDQVATELNAGTNSAAGLSNMSRQALINENFDIWQRGTSFTNPVSGAYTSDRWTIFISSAGTLPTTLTHSRQALTPGDIANSVYYYRIATDGAGGGFGANDIYSLIQRIENGTRYLCGAGKKITISFWARSSIANKKIGIRFNQSYGSGGSPSSNEIINGAKFTLTSSWQKVSFTFTTNTLAGKTFGSNNDDILGIELTPMWGSGRASQFGDTVAETFVGAGNIDITQVQVCAGESALPYQPRSFAEELVRCQRYYEKSYDYSVTPGTVNQNGAENVLASTAFLLAKQDVRFKARKRLAPTISLYSPQNGALGSSSEFNTSSAFVADRVTNTNSICENSFVAISGGGYTVNNFQRFHWTADAEI